MIDNQRYVWYAWCFNWIWSAQNVDRLQYTCNTIFIYHQAKLSQVQYFNLITMILFGL